MFCHKLSQSFENLTIRNGLPNCFLKSLYICIKLNGLGIYLQLGIPNFFDNGSIILKPFKNQ